MGIISALLTGGVLVGNVCHALGAASSKKLPNGARIIDSKLTIGGVRFMRSDDNPEHEMKTYAFNTVPHDVSFSCPNIGGGSGFEYFIKPMNKMPIDEFLSKNVLPDTRFNIGPIAQIGTSNRFGFYNLEPALKFAADNVPINNENVFITVGSVAISIAPQGITLTTCLPVTAIVNLYMVSKHGIDAESFETIMAEPEIHDGKDETKSKSKKKNISKNYFFAINIADCGFQEGDIVDCRLGVALSEDNELLRSRSNNNEPASQEEWEYLREVKAIRLC